MCVFIRSIGVNEAAKRGKPFALSAECTRARLCHTCERIHNHIHTCHLVKCVVVVGGGSSSHQLSALAICAPISRMCVRCLCVSDVRMFEFPVGCCCCCNFFRARNFRVCIYAARRPMCITYIIYDFIYKTQRRQVHRFNEHVDVV